MPVPVVDIVALGEVLWDLFPDGPRFGGAPANFACHAAALGGRVTLVSAVGQDALGDQALDFLRRQGVLTSSLLRLPAASTGCVQVTVDREGQARFEFDPLSAWDLREYTPELDELASRAGVVCFGTLGQRHPIARATIRRMLQAVSTTAWRIFDVNLRPPFYDEERIETSLRLANIVKLNEEELEVLSTLFGWTGSMEAGLRQLLEKYSLHLVALTCGAAGSILLTPAEYSCLPGQAVQVADTVGAGDAFTAALAIGLVRGMPLKEIHARATRLSAYVCTQPGAVPTLPEELRASWRAPPSPAS